MSKRSGIIEIIKKYDFSEYELNEKIDLINTFFDYFDDDKMCSEIFYRVYEHVDKDPSGKDVIVKALNKCRDAVYRQEYFKYIKPLNLGLGYPKWRVEEVTNEYMDEIKNIKSAVSLSDVIQDPLSYGVITYEGEFFPLSNMSGFTSHEELMGYLYENNFTKSRNFIQVGLKLGSAGNGFPLIRMAPMEDDSDAVSVKSFELSLEQSVAIFNIFVSNTSGGKNKMFEEFMLENFVGFGFNNGEDKTNYRINITNFSNSISSRDFDKSFLNELIEKGNNKLVIKTCVSGEDE